MSQHEEHFEVEPTLNAADHEQIARRVVKHTGFIPASLHLPLVIISLVLLILNVAQYTLNRNQPTVAGYVVQALSVPNSEVAKQIGAQVKIPAVNVPSAEQIASNVKVAVPTAQQIASNVRVPVVNVPSAESIANKVTVPAFPSPDDFAATMVKHPQLAALFNLTKAGDSKQAQADVDTAKAEKKQAWDVLVAAQAEVEKLKSAETTVANLTPEYEAALAAANQARDQFKTDKITEEAYEKAKEVRDGFKTQLEEAQATLAGLEEKREAITTGFEAANAQHVAAESKLRNAEAVLVRSQSSPIALMQADSYETSKMMSFLVGFLATADGNEEVMAAMRESMEATAVDWELTYSGVTDETSDIEAIVIIWKAMAGKFNGNLQAFAPVVDAEESTAPTDDASEPKAPADGEGDKVEPAPADEAALQTASAE